MTLKVGPRPVLQRVYVNDFSEETTEQNELKLGTHLPTNEDTKTLHERYFDRFQIW